MLSAENRASPSPKEDSAYESKRLTIQLSAKQVAELDRLAEEQNVSQAEALRKALATEVYLRNASRQGARILIKEGDDLKEVVLR